MPTAEHHIEEHDELRETAAAWFLRQRGGEGGGFDAEAFAVWLEADPAHAKAYGEIEAAWGAVGEHATTPELVAARHGALERLQRFNRKRWTPASASRLRWAAGLAATVIVALGAIWLVQSGFPSPENRSYQTAIGEQRVLTLADNTRISLDAMTRLRVDYTDNTRRVELLEGQAHFDVARDVMRPFSVRAGEQTVVALGTAFNVEIVDEQVLVTLLEGRVEVTSSQPQSPNVTAAIGSIGQLPQAVQLTPGQQLVVTSDGSRETVNPTNLQKTVSWRQGKLMFDDEPLDEAVERVNRHSHIRVELADDRVGNIKVSGVFNAGDTEAFVEAVESLFGVEAMRGNGQTVMLHAANHQPGE